MSRPVLVSRGIVETRGTVARHRGTAHTNETSSRGVFDSCKSRNPGKPRAQHSSEAAKTVRGSPRKRGPGRAMGQSPYLPAR